MERSLFMCGDIHGELKKLVYEELLQKWSLKNADILILGDFGVGFGGPNSMDVRYREVEKRLIENDLTIYTINGNHDDPSYFDKKHDYDRLKFLPSHEIIELSGIKIYPVGGAVSIDIDRKDPYTGKTRREENDNFIRRGSRRRCWWENETPILKYDNLPIKVDIIVSHDAPLSFEPIPIRQEDVKFETWEKVLETRKYLDYILEEIKCSRWFYGHYHRSYSGHIGDMLYRCLGINELFEVRGLEK